MKTERPISDEWIQNLEAKRIEAVGRRSVREAALTPLQRTEQKAAHARFRDRMASSLTPLSDAKRS